MTALLNLFRTAKPAPEVAPPKFSTSKGRAHPLGATPDDTGVNFSVFAQNATSVELLLFDEHDDAEPSLVLTLDPAVHRTFHFWHVYVWGLQPGVHYAYRVDGPDDLHGQGHRYNPSKVLIDPYARGNTNTLWNRAHACGPGDNLATSMRSVVIDASDYDWEGDQPLNRPMHETIIYEMHVGGFTRHASSGAEHPGTFAGVVEKIPYLKALGVTAVELLPVMEFDEKEIIRANPNGGSPLVNYWGYSTVSFFAPDSLYCVSLAAGNHLREFRDMVKALHQAGIEVILDVVFNHTSEGNHLGPTINFKGFGNEVYYHLVPSDRQYHMDYSGCGNTFNCNHPIAEKFISECLRFWVEEMHVDGFRFDEASILSRGQDGAPVPFPPIIWDLELAECMADTKIIAEAWDAAGLYQVGYYPGYRWAEWNGKFRDDVRRFVKGDPGLIGAVAARLAGSADLYQANGRQPINSINFVTCHDGFTLNDLVSYNGKHNEANGENNQDGSNDNQSWNCGAEGATNDHAVEALRERQVKNFAAILLLSQGVPMILAGDEVRRTQRGNNNAYCQDNAISWLDWTLAEKHAGLLRFWQEMIAFRRQLPSIHRSRFFTGQMNGRGLKDISWHGCSLNQPGWDDPQARALAFTLAGFGDDPDLYVILNMYWDGLDFELPPLPGRSWHVAVNTAAVSPDDIAEPGRERFVVGNTFRAEGRSVVVLISKD